MSNQDSHPISERVHEAQAILRHYGYGHLADELQDLITDPDLERATITDQQIDAAGAAWWAHRGSFRDAILSALEAAEAAR